MTPYIRLPGDWEGYQFAGLVDKGAGPNAYTLYVGDLSKTLTVTVNSVIYEGTCYLLPGGTTGDWMQILASYDLGAMFTLPMHVK